MVDINFVRKNKTEYIANVASVFDIEASSFYEGDEKRCCMYAWVFGINGQCIRGRTWEEFLQVIDKIIKKYYVNLDRRFVIYVHNLSYEFQWFKNLFEWHKVFSLDNRQPIYAVTKSGIEFRCSYLLTGLSLAKVGENLTKYKVKKMSGDLDYQKIRHSKTPLSRKEWKYILNDGLVVMAFIQEEIERLGSIANIPYTKTGYVRNLCRDNCLKGPNKFNYSKMIRKLTMTEDDYKEAKLAFAGGFTHANNNYVNKKLRNVYSYDFTSSYPAVMLSEEFPMSKAIPYEIKDLDDFVSKLKLYCCIFIIKFNNLRSKVDYEHYISRSKCIELEDYLIDNGRVVKAKTLSICITEQDFFIISEMYTWDSIEISEFKYFYKDYLPKDLIITILELYQDKTKLKDVENKVAEYFVAKGMLNSCYGMSVTDPCKDEVIYDDDWHVEKGDIAALINSYNKSTNRFLFYFWGIWITAYARRNLFTGINEFKNDYIYADTDSIKVIRYTKHKKYIEEYNNQIQEKINNCLRYYNIPLKYARPESIKGEVKLLGIWDYEGKYSDFKTLGAKRYMYVKNKKLHITISGVNKKNGVDYLFYKYKNIPNIFRKFTDGLVFPARYIEDGIEKNGSGKLCHTYIDTYMCSTVKDYLGNTGTYCEFSGVHMEPTSYNLGLDENFKNYLLGIRGLFTK